MKKSLIALALVGAFAAPAIAEEAAGPHSFSANAALVSDYVFRGISQTQNRPAIQGGFDYSHSSGLYLGTWGSNVSWVQDTGMKTNNSLELDVYGGYKGAVGPVSYDVGVLQYYYPGDVVAGVKNTNSTEVYVGVGFSIFTLKYSHAVSSNLFGWYNAAKTEKTRGSGYWDLSAAYDLGDGWGVSAHVGHQTIKNLSAASYTDWKLGVTKDLGVGVLGLSYTDTNAKASCSAADPYCWNGKDVGKGRAILSFSKSF